MQICGSKKAHPVIYTVAKSAEATLLCVCVCVRVCVCVITTAEHAGLLD